MIQAGFYWGQTDGSLHLTVTGHAHAGPKGHDLVCAGVSVLACTLGSAVGRLYEQAMLARCPKVQLEEGDAKIIAVPKEENREAVQMVFWTIQNGMAAMAECFPGNVELTQALKIEEKGKETV